MTAPVETDVIIVGAGPIGLFAVFELGLLDLKAHLVDILDRPGGQCTELYPEKPIYDIPGLPIVTGQELSDRLMEQIKPFGAQFHLAQMASALRSASTTAGGNSRPMPRRRSWRRSWSLRRAAAASCPSARPSPASRPMKARASTMPCARWRCSAGKNILIAGGGDSALDWTINLAPIAKSLTLVHHRDGFRAAQHSVNQMRELVEQGKVQFEVASVKGAAWRGRQARSRDAGRRRQEANGATNATRSCRSSDYHQARSDRGFRTQSARKSDSRGYGEIRKHRRRASSRSATSIPMRAS